MAADWDKIKAEYVKDEKASYRNLAEKYGVPFGTLRRVAKRENWPGLRTQSEHKANTKIVQHCAQKKAQKVADIIDIADELIKKLSSSMGNIDPEDYDRMMQAANILFKLRETKRGLTAADAREQEARIAKLQKEAEKTEDTTNELSVSFESCDPEWQK